MSADLNDSVLAPQIVLRPQPDGALYLQDEPVEILGRYGIHVLFADGPREITYSALSSSEAAVDWICRSAAKQRDEVREIRHWGTGELLRWGSFQARQAARGEQMRAQVMDLLG